MLNTFCCVALIGLAGQATEKPAVAQASLGNLEKHWNELASRDKTRAELAMLALTRSPQGTTTFFKERLKPVKVDAKKVAQWLADLGTDNIETQIQAIENLEYCGKYIRSDLEKALESAPKTEAKQIIEQLQAKLPLKVSPSAIFFAQNTTTSNGVLSWKLACDNKGNLQISLNDVAIDSSKLLNAPSRPWVRAQRAVAILEHFGTPEARHLLESLATGEAEALPTVAARAALGRQKGVVEQVESGEFGT